MDDQLTPEQKFNAESEETAVPRALLEGKDPETVIATLMADGWTREAAQSPTKRFIRLLS